MYTRLTLKVEYAVSHMNVGESETQDNELI